MLRRYVWPLLGMSALLLGPATAPAKPNSGGLKPTPTNAVPLPSHKQKLTAPACGTLPGAPPQRHIPSADRKVTKIEAKFAIGAIGATIPLRASLTLQDGGVVPYQEIEFKVDNQVLGTAKTNSKGEATFNYKVPNKFGPKPFVARYVGNTKCKAANDSTSVGTVRSSTTVTLDHRDYANVNHKTLIQGRLTRITDGAAIGGREVELYAQGKKIATAVTDSYGRLTADFTPTSGAGKPLAIKAQFLGDVLYNPSVANNSTPLYPPRQTVYVFTNNVTGYYGATVKVPVIVTIGSSMIGQKYAGAPLRVLRERGDRWPLPRYERRQVGTATTNQFGLAQASYKITEKPMRYTLWAYADVPRERYDVVPARDALLTVLKAPVQLVVSGPSSVHIGESTSYTVKALRTTDAQAVEGLKVCVLNYKCSTTDAKGKASLTFTVPTTGGTGARTFTFNSTENDFHLAGAKAVSVQALPSVN